MPTDKEVKEITGKLNKGKKLTRQCIICKKFGNNDCVGVEEER